MLSVIYTKRHLYCVIYADCHNKPFTLNVAMLNVIMLNVVMLSVILLSVMEPKGMGSLDLFLDRGWLNSYLHRCNAIDMARLL